MLQDEVAYEAEISRSYLSQLEKGAFYARLKIIGKLSEVLYQPARIVILGIPKKGRILIRCGECGRFAMTAIGLRDDFDGPALRLLARRTKDGPQARRLLALAAIYGGGSRTEAARIGGVTLQSVRDWVLRFNAKGLAGLIDLKAPGPRRKLDDAQRLALKETVEAGPIPAVHGVVRWRLIDLVQWLYATASMSECQRRLV